MLIWNDLGLACCLPTPISKLGLGIWIIWKTLHSVIFFDLGIVLKRLRLVLEFGTCFLFKVRVGSLFEFVQEVKLAFGLIISSKTISRIIHQNMMHCRNLHDFVNLNSCATFLPPAIALWSNRLGREARHVATFEPQIMVWSSAITHLPSY